MLFLRILIALGMIIILFSTAISINVNKNTITDKELETHHAILDQAIVTYYINHSGSLPENLNEDTLYIMGLDNIDISKFNYQKVADNSFILTVELSTSKKITSANSNKLLPVIEKDI